jgi:hypothetical protein
MDSSDREAPRSKTGGRMTKESISVLKTHWQRLRLYHFSGSVLTDYRIIRNAVRLLQRAGAMQ